MSGANGDGVRGRRDRDGRRCRRSATTSPRPGRACSPASRASGRSRCSTRRGSTRRSPREVRDFDPSGRHRPQGDAADGPLHPVRARGRAPGARPGGAARPAWTARSPSGPACILGSGLGGVATLFDNVLLMAERGPDRISPVLHPDGHRQRRLGPGRDRLRDARAELRDRVGLRDRRPRDRRGVGDDPARRRRHHARRRHRGGDPRGGRRRLRVDEGPLDPQRRSGGAPRGRSTRAATASSSARAPGCSCSRSSSHAEQRGADAARRAGRLRRDRRRDRTSRCRRRAASARFARASGPSRRRAWTPGRSTTSTPTRPRRPEGDSAELQALATLLGEHAPGVSITRPEVDARPHARRRRRDRVDRDDPGDARGRRAADDQPRRPRPERQRPRPHARTRRRSAPIRAALNNSFGFGGQNAALVFRRWDG